MKKTIIICVSLLVVIGVVAIVALNNESDISNIGYEIEFAADDDETVLSETTLIYNLDQLKPKIHQQTSFIYLNPKLTDYTIVSKLGFDVSDYSVMNDGSRFYGDGANEYMIIDQFGCFSYDSGAHSDGDSMALTEGECLDIAKEFLNKYGLFSERLGTKWSTNERISYSESEGEKLLGIGINFFPAETDGLSTGGNARVTVYINANGEVEEVSYNLREYTDKQNVELISLEEAIKRFEQGKAFIEVENPSEKLVFENVTLGYWSQERNTDNLVVQPVYILQGTSITTTGESEPFTITIQANKFKGHQSDDTSVK